MPKLLDLTEGHTNVADAQWQAGRNLVLFVELLRENDEGRLAQHCVMESRGKKLRFQSKAPAKSNIHTNSQVADSRGVGGRMRLSSCDTSCNISR